MTELREYADAIMEIENFNAHMELDELLELDISLYSPLSRRIRWETEGCVVVGYFRKRRRLHSYIDPYPYVGEPVLTYCQGYCIDIATVVTWPWRQGAFKRLIEHLKQQPGLCCIKVESIHSQKLLDCLPRYNFKPFPGDETHSQYWCKQEQVS